MKQLRDYQEVACDFIDKELKNFRRPFVYVLPTGAGKSLCISEIAKRWGRVLVLTLSKELCFQDYQEMLEQGIDASIYSASWKKKEVGAITVATIMSAYKQPWLFANADVVLIDETDSVDCSRIDSVFMNLLIEINKIKKQDGKRIKVVGLTACVDGDTEVLTPTGFVKFSDLKGEDGTFAQWTPPKEGSLGEIKFEKATIFRGWAEEMNSYKWEKEGTEFLFTDGHTIPVEFHKYNGEVFHKDEKAGKAKWHDNKRFYLAGAGVGEDTLTDFEKLGIFIQADGCRLQKMSEGKRSGLRKYAFSLKKKHKIAAITPILSRNSFPHRQSGTGRKYFTGEIYLPYDNVKKLSSFLDITNISYSKAREIIYWASLFDGHKYEDKSIEYYTCDKDNADFMQAVGVLGGYMSRVVAVPYDKKSNRVQPYKVYFRDHPTRTTSAIVSSRKEWNKEVYCLHTKTGYFVARKNGRVFITGNTPWRTVQKVRRQGRFYETTTMIQPLNRIPCKGGFLWSKIVEGLTMKEATERGYLTPVEYYCSPMEGKLVINSSGNDFTEDSLDVWGENAVSRCLSVMKGAEEKWNIRSGIVALPFIRHAEALQALCESEKVSSVVVHSKTPQKAREEAIKAFKEGKIKWLIQCGVITTGFDSPITDTLIWCRPCLSARLWVQACGRVARLSPGKSVARVLDLTRTYELFGRTDDFHLGKDGYKTTIMSGNKTLSGIPLRQYKFTKERLSA